MGVVCPEAVFELRRLGAGDEARALGGELFDQILGPEDRIAWLTRHALGLEPGLQSFGDLAGECVDGRELESVSALLARFPSLYRAHLAKEKS